MSAAVILTPTQLSMLKRLRADLKTDDLSADTAKTIDAVDYRYKPSSARVVFTMLKKVYPGNADFIAQSTSRTKTAIEVAQAQEPTPEQVSAHVPWEDIIAWRDSEDFKSVPIESRLLVGLYTYMPPQRLDYTPMRVVTRLPKTLETDMNYLIIGLKRARFVFHSYKTAKIYGDRMIEAPKPLVALLNEYLGTRRKGFLFEKKDKPWTENKLGTHIRLVYLDKFGKIFGVNNLRHSYITHENKGAPSLAAMKESATAMGHDLITHQAYRHISLE
jgi:hypothetical protein